MKNLKLPVRIYRNILRKRRRMRSWNYTYKTSERKMRFILWGCSSSTVRYRKYYRTRRITDRNRSEQSGKAA
jgi:hypothetical protein